MSIIVGTLNVGGNDEDLFQNQPNEWNAFAAKLGSCLRALVDKNCDVIMLQEIAKIWRPTAKEALQDWKIVESE